MPGGGAADAGAAHAVEQPEVQSAAAQQQEDKGPPLALPAEPPAAVSPLGDGSS